MKTSEDATDPVEVIEDATGAENGKRSECLESSFSL